MLDILEDEGRGRGKDTVPEERTWRGALREKTLRRAPREQTAMKSWGTEDFLGSLEECLG